MNAVKEVVQQKYGEAALQARSGQKAGCGCGTSACCGSDPITSNLYDEAQAAAIPAEAMLASLGCGNPTALAELKPGEVVLDLGSGGGIDVLLSAKRVGPTGKAYGLDMTDEMLALARENQAKSGLTNVEFLKGEIEHIPLPDNSVDVIISNCVINLSADKDRVIAEAFRVLKPGGRFAVSDVVVRGEDVPAAVRRSMELWVGCVAGALEERELPGEAGRRGVRRRSTLKRPACIAPRMRGIFWPRPGSRMKTRWRRSTAASSALSSVPESPLPQEAAAGRRVAPDNRGNRLRAPTSKPHPGSRSPVHASLVRRSTARADGHGPSRLRGVSCRHSRAAAPKHRRRPTTRSGGSPSGTGRLEPRGSEVLFSGRYQHEFAALDADQGDLDEWNVRRMRLGPRVTLFRTFTLHAEVELNPQEARSVLRAFHGLLRAVEPGAGDSSLTRRQARRSVHDGRRDVVQGASRHRPQQPRPTTSGFRRSTCRASACRAARALGLSCAASTRQAKRTASSASSTAASSRSASSATISRSRSARRKRSWPATTCISIRIPNNTFTRQLEHIVSVNFKFEADRWGVRTDLSGGDGVPGPERPVGLDGHAVRQRHQTSSSSSAATRSSRASDPNGVRLATYESRVVRGRGDEYNELYLGANYYFYGHKLKLQSGVQFADMNDRAGDGGRLFGRVVDDGLARRLVGPADMAVLFGSRSGD